MSTGTTCINLTIGYTVDMKLISQYISENKTCENCGKSIKTVCVLQDGKVGSRFEVGVDCAAKLMLTKVSAINKIIKTNEEKDTCLAIWVKETNAVACLDMGVFYIRPKTGDWYIDRLNIKKFWPEDMNKLRYPKTFEALGY